MKQAFFLTCLLLMLGLIGKGWHSVNAGFNPRKLYCVLPDNPEWEISYSPEEISEIRKILDQEFTYFSKGRQSFVFLSQDQKYVIKLFRYQLCKPKFWHYLLWREKLQEKMKSKKQKLSRWMSSYKLAYDRIRSETGLVFVHLVRSDGLLPEVTIRDPLGRKRKVDLNRTGFLVQKKVDLFYATVKGLMKKGDKEGLKRVISAYFRAMASYHEKGIWNLDFNWMSNVGNIGLDEVCEFDMGRYGTHHFPKIKWELHHALCFYTKHFREYFAKEMPSILPDFDKSLEEVCDSFYPGEKTE